MALDSATNAVAPRSVARYLEGRIAALEGASRRKSGPTWASAGQFGKEPWEPSHGAETSSPLNWNSAVNNVLWDITTPFLGLTSSIRLAGCAAAPTQIPSAKRSFGSTELDENHPRSILNQHCSTVSLASLPLKIAEFLFKIYTSRIILQYPIFYSTDVVQSFDAIFHQASPDAARCSKTEAWNTYVISLIMAISLSTSARNNQARAQSLAMGLFRTAMLHVSSVLSNDLAGLQALLLLIQYAFLNPSVANLWLLTGLSSEACIDMGLHQDLPANAETDVLKRDLRRRVFWCAWEMEVAVCAGFHRQVRTLNKYINVAFPSEFDDSAISTTGIDTTTPRSKFVSRRIWLFRQVESDIMSVLYQNEPLPESCLTLEEWMATTEKNIHDWRQEVHQMAAMDWDPHIKSQWNEMKLYADIAYNYILVLLFRPCPREKMPSRSSLMKAFTAAVKVATGYWEQGNAEIGHIKYVFHPCHHTFSSAVVFLQALQRCKVEIAHSYTLEEVENYMSYFSRFFSTISERWPAADRCLQEYERLLGPIKKEYSDFVLGQSQNIAQQQSMNELPISEAFGHTVTISDSFHFWPDFNPYIGTEGADPVDMYPHVPYDWNDEFGFGMDLCGPV